MMNIISLGAGVQSSTMALMAAHKEITPMPDCAIFADTQAEPKAVYEWLDWLEKQLPFPVYRVTAGNLADDSSQGINSKGQKFYVVPWYMNGSIGRRQCSAEYKVKPIYRKMREMGATFKNPFTVWIGISRDEAHRAKPARVKYAENIFPLLDKDMYRLSCLEWMEKKGYPKPPRSACSFCPYHSNAEFESIKLNDPEAWDVAVKVDNAIRSRGVMQYAHRSLVPLEFADLSAKDKDQINMFGNECEGMCGV
jgi:hypothetical protein